MPSSIEWLDWSPDSIELGRKKGRPILLSINGIWCGACHYMDRTTYSSPSVISDVNEQFIPIRVLMDERPDICERFNIGGFPSVVFLTPNLDVLYATAYVPPQQFKALLTKVVESYKRGERFGPPKIALERAIPDLKAEKGIVNEAIILSVEKAVLDGFDEDYGGFLKKNDFPPGWNYAYRGFAYYSVEPKIPYPQTIEFLLMRYLQTGRSKLLDMATKTLDAMSEGIQDTVDGGFYRYAHERDWTGPHTEKLIEVNAAVLRAYVSAYQVTKSQRFLKTAAAITDFVQSTLRNGEGGFFGCLKADATYNALSFEERERVKDSLIDHNIYTNWSAAMISSYLEASVALNRPELRAFALTSINFLLERSYDAKVGMYHKYDGQRSVPGILSDQVQMATALMAAYEVTGNRRHLENARGLIDLTVGKLFDHEFGGFFDVKTDGSTLTAQIKPLIDNSLAAELLLRFDATTGEERYRHLSKSTLEAFAKTYENYGHFSSCYASAVDLFLHGPLLVTIIGQVNDARAEGFRTSARSAYVPGRVIRCFDPETDADLLSEAGYQSGPTSLAIVCFNNVCLAPVKEPTDLPSVMVEAYKGLSPRSLLPKMPVETVGNRVEGSGS